MKYVFKLFNLFNKINYLNCLINQISVLWSLTKFQNKIGDYLRQNIFPCQVACLPTKQNGHNLFY